MMDVGSDSPVDTLSQVVAALNVAKHQTVRRLGLSLLDVDHVKLQLCEFQDDGHFTLLESVLLQTRPTRCIVKLTSDMSIDKKRLQCVLQRCGVKLLIGSQQDFVETVEANDLQRLLRDAEQYQFLANDIQQLQLAKQALNCVLKESGVYHDFHFQHQFSVSILPIHKVMRLDQAAFSALTILPSTGERWKSPTSLFGLLNKTRTAFGQNRLLTWISQPSLDFQEITERHDIVQLGVLHGDLRKSLQQDHLRVLPNLDAFGAKFHKAAMRAASSDMSPMLSSSSSCSLEDIHSLHQGILEIHAVFGILELIARRSAGTKEAATLERRIMAPLKKALDRLIRFNDLVEYTLDKQEIETHRKFYINKEFDPRLTELANTKNELWNDIEKHRAEVEDDLGIGKRGGGGRRSSDCNQETVRVVECSSFGWVFRVTKKDQRVIQERRTQYQSVRINKAEFQFTTKKLTALAGEFREALEQFEAQQNHLAQKTVAAASSYWPVLEPVADAIGELDILLGFAEVASDSASKYVRPEMCDQLEARRRTEEGGVVEEEDTSSTTAQHQTHSRHIAVPSVHHPKLEASILSPSALSSSSPSDSTTISSSSQRILQLVQNRHPLVEHQLQLRRPSQRHVVSGPPTEAVNEFVANSISMHSPDRLLNVITGPNMGGKSTYIRSIAITCLMAQVGSFVPCASAKLSLVDSILCRVGASDDQLRGVSTFLAEMIEATAITKFATENSLVLIDELGRGTSTFEGLGLAWEIARYLACTTKCMTLFATHFHDLGDLASEVPIGIFNSQVTVSIDGPANQLVFLYGVKPGCADLSYGIDVAELSGFPPTVLARAREKAAELEAGDKRTTRQREKRKRMEDGSEDVEEHKTRKLIYDLLERMVWSTSSDRLHPCPPHSSARSSEVRDPNKPSSWCPRGPQKEDDCSQHFDKSIVLSSRASADGRALMQLCFDEFDSLRSMV